MVKCDICQEASNNLFTMGCFSSLFHKACIAQLILNDLDSQCPQCQTKIDKSKIKPVGTIEGSQSNFTLRSAGQMAHNADLVALRQDNQNK